MAAGLYSTVLITIAVVISGIMGIMVLLASAFLVRASMKLKRSRGGHALLGAGDGMEYPELKHQKGGKM